MDILAIIILLVILLVVLQVCSEDIYNWFQRMCGFDIAKSDDISDDESEKFNGALQSLYSNDGIQDTYLTVNSYNGGNGYGWDNNWGGIAGGYGWGFDPYRYWRGIPWNLPTRNLNRVTYYPYLYDYNIDRYGRFYPYW